MFETGGCQRGPGSGAARAPTRPLPPEYGAERRRVPLVRALQARREGETADPVQILEQTAPVARHHLVHRNGGLSVLSGDGERQGTPDDRLEEGFGPVVAPLTSGRPTDVSTSGCPRAKRPEAGQPLV